MRKLKSSAEIEILKEGGRRHARILSLLSHMVKPGVTTQALEDRARELIREGGDTPAFLNYTPYGAKRPFPAALCVSINDEVVHGIPNEKPRTLSEGDLVSLDLGLVHKDLITDMAVTLPVGRISKEAEVLMNVTKEALAVGIGAARLGGRTGDIGAAIEAFVRPYGFGIVEELAGHGVGYKVHEDPYVPNYGTKGTGEKLLSGMVLALEPMLTLGGRKITLDADGYTYRTADGSLAAHFEKTIAVTDDGIIVLTEDHA